MVFPWSIQWEHWPELGKAFRSGDEFRSSYWMCSVRKGILRNFAKSTCARVSFLIKLQASAWNFIKIEILAQVFSYEFYEISKNAFFTEHLLETASINFQKQLFTGAL